MKKIKYLLVILFGALLLPMCVNAEVKADKDIDPNSKEVKVYLFRGDGCPHCEEAIEWFKSLEKTMGDKFEVIGYETWQNTDNDSLMRSVSEAREDDADGVPYILVGDQSWNGFDQSYEEAITKTIESEYDTPVKERRDVVAEVLNGTYKNKNNTGKGESTDTTSTIVLIVIIVLGAAGAGCYYYFVSKKKNETTVVTKVPEKKKSNKTKK